MEKCKKKDCDEEVKVFVHSDKGVLRFCLKHYKEYSAKQLKDKFETAIVVPIKNEKRN